MGKKTENTKENQTKGTVVQVVCCVCNIETNHIVCQSLEHETLGAKFEKSGYSCDSNAHLLIDLYDSFQIIQCQGCNSISFRQVRNCSEYDNDTVFLYPHRSKTTKPIKDYFHVPRDLQLIYSETIECFNHDNSYLCAAGLRAIVEGVCADQKITDGPELTSTGDQVKKNGKPLRKNALYHKIIGLVEKGILTKEQANILHFHRNLGNDALHELQRPSAKELSLAIDVLENVLDVLYESPKKGDVLKDFKEKRSNKKKL